MALALAQEQINHFCREGYLRIGKILEDDELVLLREQYELEFEKARESNTYTNLSIEAGDDSEAKEIVPQRMLQITQMCERNIHYRRLVHNEKILDIAEDLIGPNIQLFHDQALFKPASDGGAVFWHQDNAYWTCRPANLISCWLTLDDTDTKNGAMQVIPGSHLTLVPHELSKERGALLYVKDQDDSRAVAIELPAGGCMFHHCQTLHYTQPNETDRQRRAFVIHLMMPGTRSAMESDKNFEVGFKRPLLRAKA